MSQLTATDREQLLELASALNSLHFAWCQLSEAASDRVIDGNPTIDFSTFLVADSLADFVTGLANTAPLTHQEKVNTIINGKLGNLVALLNRGAI